MISPIRYVDDELQLLDQRVLPHEETWISCSTPESVAQAIRDMVVRGAPAIGVSAAYGVLLATRDAGDGGADLLRERLAEAGERLEAARPTAVNLSWAVRRMLGVASRALDDGLPVAEVARRLETEARGIHEEDVEMNRRLGRHGSMLVPDRARILTHCNTGGLATAGFGTALGVVRAAVEDGKAVTVVAGETRPFLQGSRLTAWELAKDGIPVELITDSMAGALLARGEIDLVVVGADRIARNGDVANKIGTYPLAVLARRHGVPFYVAAPTSTIDASSADGRAIPIEERDPEDVLSFGGRRIAPEGVHARHIAFDVTPSSLVTAIVTEEGIARAPFTASLAQALGLDVPGESDAAAAIAEAGESDQEEARDALDAAGSAEDDRDGVRGPEEDEAVEAAAERKIASGPASGDAAPVEEPHTSSDDAPIEEPPLESDDAPIEEPPAESDDGEAPGSLPGEPRDA